MRRATDPTVAANTRTLPAGVRGVNRAEAKPPPTPSCLLVAATVVSTLTEPADSAPDAKTITPPEADAPPSVAADTREPEEVIVTGSLPDPGFRPTFEYMQQTYDARGKGGCLYRRGDFEESFPYLLAAAKRGFKMAQARVSFLYKRGLGTPRDTEAAVGWLAVAAPGTTHPSIRYAFRDLWQRIPAEYLPHLERVADAYRSKYGSRRHRVNCDLSATASTHLKMLTCRFQDEGAHADYSFLLDALAAPGTPAPTTAVPLDAIPQPRTPRAESRGC